MTTNPRSREAAYADLVAGLVDARVDVASERFDAEVEAAEASGRLDPATARLLRWWQRESVRSVAEHVRTTVPATLVSLERAEHEAREAVQRADAAWTTARGVTGRATQPDPASREGSARESWAPEGREERPTASYRPTPPAPPLPPSPPAPAPPASPFASPAYSTPRTPEPAAVRSAPPAPPSPPVPPPPPPAPPAAGGPLPPPFTGRVTGQFAGYVAGDDEAPSLVDLTTTEPPARHAAAPAPARTSMHEGPPPPPPPGPYPPSSTGGATPGAGRRRTLLAGLTVLPQGDE